MTTEGTSQSWVILEGSGAVWPPKGAGEPREMALCCDSSGLTERE